jgi:alkylation response protein AidB-like acyl-CoA dehydrogenase
MPVSFDLTEDQFELQKWVHEFAANVVRPAAHEYDERKEFPWPVLQEAAKIGLYSLDFFATQWFDESGLGIPLTMEELFWGDAAIGLAIVGTTLAAASAPCAPARSTTRRPTSGCSTAPRPGQPTAASPRSTW